MRQQLLSPPGCQLWNTACCASSPGGRFAYCSTLAIYIYGSDYVLEKIIGGFEKTITALCWCAAARMRRRRSPRAARPPLS